jgi:hypothetical protein
VLRRAASTGSDVPAVAVPPPLTCSLPVRIASAGLMPHTSRRLPCCNVWANVERPCPESTERPVQRVSATASRDFRYSAERTIGRILAHWLRTSACN